MINFFKGFILSFSLYTRLPLPQINFNPSAAKYIFYFFPLTGLFISALQVVWYFFAQYLGLYAPLYAGISTAIPILITGGIHLDGYIDVCDAYFSRSSREKMKQILRDPHVGAFAVIYTIIYIFLNFSFFTEFYEQNLPLFVIFLVYPLSRALTVFLISILYPADGSNMLYSVSSLHNNTFLFIISLFYIGFIMNIFFIYESSEAGILAIFISFISIIGFKRFCYKNFGGISGDLAGFFIQVFELIFMLLFLFYGLLS